MRKLKLEKVKKIINVFITKFTVEILKLVMAEIIGRKLNRLLAKNLKRRPLREAIFLLARHRMDL